MWMGSIGVKKSASKGITPTIQPGSKQPNRTKSLFTTINTTTTATAMDHKNNTTTTTTSGRGPPLHGGRDGPCLRRGAQAAVDGAAQGEVVKHAAHKHTTPTRTHIHTHMQTKYTNANAHTHTHAHTHLQTKHSNTQTHTW